MVYDSSAFHMLRYPNVTTAAFASFIPELSQVEPLLLSRIDIEGMYSKPYSLPSTNLCIRSTHSLVFVHLSVSNMVYTGSYHPHLTRQEADLKVFLEDESLLLDPSMEYSEVPGLSSEVVERLYRVRPTTIVRVLLSLISITIPYPDLGSNPQPIYLLENVSSCVDATA